MQLTQEQTRAFEILKSGVNTFMTGGAGVGKSFVLKEFINYAKSSNKNIMVTAPTGIASLHIQGVTLHRAFKIPLGVLDYRYNNIEANDEIVNTDIVVIDEISMCRIDTFEFVAKKILSANEKRQRRGLGNIQLVLVGDFFQLPPVTLTKEKEILDNYYKTDIGLGYAFTSKYWKYFDFYNIVLTEVNRQQDKEFIDNLNKIRTGSKAYIDQIVKQSSPVKIDGAIELCGKNQEALEINNRELEKIGTQAYTYLAKITGLASEEDVIADNVLNIKVGARVMTLVNDFGCSNGELGTVVALYSNAIQVKLDRGTTVVVTEYTWNIYDYRQVEDTETGKISIEQYEIGTFTQFPLKLAYAITIHKCQGQTYDMVNISPYCWECGQLYVAISRVRTISNIHFNYVPDTSYIYVSLNVIKFYNELSNERARQVTKKRTEKHADYEDDLLSVIQKLGNKN